MSLIDISFNIFSSTFIYAILALQVSSGFPPFYVNFKCDSHSLVEQKKHKDIQNLRTVFPYFIALFVSMVLIGLTGSPIFVLIGAIFAFLIGLNRRKHLKTRVEQPQKWLMDISPLLNIFISRYPMGLFDLWTSSFILLVGGLMVLSKIAN